MLGLASTIAMRVRLLIDPPPLPTLPFDLIQEILCRLPVKLLLQLRCVCKLWNSLISDPKFAIYPLHSVFTDNVETDVTEYTFPSNDFDQPYFVGSCNGILCISSFNNTSVILWNPSINKFKEISLFENRKVTSEVNLTYGFFYDSFKDKYKVVVVLEYTEVKVHTLGTNSWKNISEFPFGVKPIGWYGKFVSGRINWLAFTNLSRQSPCFIVSFDLGNESFQKIFPPDYVRVDVCNLTLNVLRDCLCIISGDDIWIMKEYGIQESWTKLFTVSNMPRSMNSYILTEVVYIFEDDQVLLRLERNPWTCKFVVYDLKNSTFMFTRFQSFSQEVFVESLISP